MTLRFETVLDYIVEGGKIVSDHDFEVKKRGDTLVVSDKGGCGTVRQTSINYDRSGYGTVRQTSVNYGTSMIGNIAGVGGNISVNGDSISVNGIGISVRGNRLIIKDDRGCIGSIIYNGKEIGLGHNHDTAPAEEEGEKEYEIDGEIDEVVLNGSGSVVVRSDDSISQNPKLIVEGSGSMELETDKPLKSLTLHVKGSGDIEAILQEAKSVKALVTGSGDISVSARHAGEADLTVMGSGNIEFGGKADTISKSVMGSGGITIIG